VHTEYFLAPPPRVIAHRGLATIAPENTLLAFLQAINIGVTHIETDVHASADGVAMISHDADLFRLAGKEVKVSQLTAAELRLVALGDGQGFCSLADALDAFGDTRFNIDLKSADAIPGTVKAIQDTRAHRRVLVTSFSRTRRLEALRNLPGVATSASAPEALLAVQAARFGASRVLHRILRGVQAVQIPVKIAGLSTITERVIRTFHEAGVEVHLWTINDPEQMKELLRLGADALITDRADLAVPIVTSIAKG